MSRPRIAEADPRLGARLVSRRRLLYSDAAAPEWDRPAHVRSASAMQRHRGELVVVSDDASFVTFVDRASAAVTAVPLPPDQTGARQFDELRGNKARKLDLESSIVCAVDGAPSLVAFGSGSTAAREKIAVVRLEGQRAAQVFPAPALYAALHAEKAFSGSELNIEGAVLVGNQVRFFQRGNGAPRNGLRAVDATADVRLTDVLAAMEGRDIPCPLESVVEYDLGRAGDVRLTFTDATTGMAGRILYTAAAERSPDSVQDGPVEGAAIGILAEAPRYALLTDAEGRRLHDKVEGITLEDERTALVVIDADDPMRPSELCTVELTGPWWE